jgi:hypothetical protein
MADSYMQFKAQKEDPRPNIGEDLTPEQRHVAHELCDKVKDDVSADKDRPLGKATGGRRQC